MNKKMKKLGLYTLALLSLGLVACNQDFETEFVPQTNLPESKLQMSDISFSANTETTIKLSDYINEEEGTEKPILIGTVSVKEGAMPANTTLMAKVEFSKNADFEGGIVLDADIDENNVISVKASNLQDTYFNGITRNPAETPLYMRTTLYTLTGGTSLAVVGKPGENYYAQRNVQFTPLNKVQISPAYYVIGAAGGWSADGARTQKFSHSGADVYDDPIFTIVVDAGGDDCWFAIGDDAALDAIANDNDWTKLFGTKGASEDLTGTMDYRYNLGGDHSFHVTGAKKIRITLDMLEYTYKIEPVDIADAYYLVGGPGSWSSDKSLKFSHSGADVFDDPVFTYVFEGNGGTGDIWFTFGDAEALDAIDNGNWTKLFGYDGEFGLTGKFERRYVMGEGVENTFHVDGSAKFYRFQVNMMTKTYTITPLNFAEYIYEAGVNNGWGGYQQPLYCADGNGTYTGYFYAQKDDSWTGGKGAFKFRGDADGWNNGNYGTGTFNDATLTGTLIDGDNSGNIMPAPGFYRADVNLADMTFKLTAINSVYVVGNSIGDWNTGVAMTFNHEKHCWECDATFLEASDPNIKFKGNGTWDSEDGNWGGTMDNIINGSNDNIPVNLSGDVHIEFYPLCDTKSYCTITAK